MLDSRRDYNKKQIKDNLNTHSVIDLTKYKPEEQYLCDSCTVVLLPFPQAQLTNLMSRGPFYICPQCHLVTDFSLVTTPERLDEIKPIDIGPPAAFAIAAETKGFEKILKERNKEIQDPEPNEEAYLKSIGATIISKTLDVRRDY